MTTPEHATSGDYPPVRTLMVDYTGSTQAMDTGDLFDEVVEVFEKYGFKVEGGSDVPFDEAYNGRPEVGR